MPCCCAKRRRKPPKIPWLKLRLHLTPDQFANRHIGPDADEARAMLEVIGHESLEGFMDTVVPEAIRAPGH